MLKRRAALALASLSPYDVFVSLIRLSNAPAVWCGLDA
jgi:hypothetical protein